MEEDFQPAVCQISAQDVSQMTMNAAALVSSLQSEGKNDSDDSYFAQHPLKRKIKNARLSSSNHNPKIAVGKLLLDERKLRQAASEGNSDTVEVLLDDGVDPSAADEKKRTALHVAAAKGDETCVRMLLNAGADPNQKDVIGNTPMHLAACTCQIPVVTLLLKAGTDVNAADQSGRSPAHLAVSRLKMLQRDASCTSDQLKLKAMQVVSMMREFLLRSGKSSELPELNRLGDMMEDTTSKEQFDEVGDLLSQFAGMQVNRL